jgi:hypothetical protein
VACNLEGNLYFEGGVVLPLSSLPRHTPPTAACHCCSHMHMHIHALAHVHVHVHLHQCMCMCMCMWRTAVSSCGGGSKWTLQRSKELSCLMAHGAPWWGRFLVTYLGYKVKTVHTHWGATSNHPRACSLMLSDFCLRY